jgi:purine-binding chemotaxis protein CheW
MISDSIGVARAGRPPLAEPSTAAALAAVPVVVGDRRWALPLGAVERVEAMVAVTDLPASPAGVCGTVNVHGEMVPVLDLEVRLGGPPRQYGADAMLVLARTRLRRVALPVDDVLAVIAIDPASIGPAPPGVPAPVDGIAALPDGALLIADVDAFLSAADEAALAAALEGAAR